MASKILRWGNSVGVLLPAHGVRQLGISVVGTPVRVIVAEDCIRIVPANQPRPSRSTSERPITATLEEVEEPW
jgi:antitoxin component of MazEF toxin-antitoxin module